MPVLTRGSFSLNLGFFELGGELSEEDRQCAWELYAELSTRAAVTGKCADQDCTDFSGELYTESLDSLYGFFQHAREIMRKFPVGRIHGENRDHLGVMINRAMTDVLRPFLEKWHVEYRHWWAEESNPRLPPMQRQKDFPKHKEFMEDWKDVRQLMRALQRELVKVYKLIDVGAAEPQTED